DALFSLPARGGLRHRDLFFFLMLLFPNSISNILHIFLPLLGLENFSEKPTSRDETPSSIYFLLYYAVPNAYRHRRSAPYINDRQIGRATCSARTYYRAHNTLY